MHRDRDQQYSESQSSRRIMSMPATRPAAAPAVEAVIKQVIDEKFGGPAACTLPEDKEVFSHHEAAFDRVQRYAFANGFAVVESQVDTHNASKRLLQLLSNNRSTRRSIAGCSPVSIMGSHPTS
jgi:hypothetical protein